MRAEEEIDMSDQTGDPAREGRVSTTDHDVIRRWADDRHATPSTVAGTEHDGHLGVLRLDLEFGQEFEDLEPVSWDAWFAAFDEQGLQFVYDETPRPDGSPSNEFHIAGSQDAR
jgi:hypothetical protein